MRLLTALLCGMVFGIGLALGGMTSPTRVLAFLDVSGQWDPALLFVLGGAVGVGAIAFRAILARPAPILDRSFHLPGTRRADLRLVIGSAIFGVGWGVAGYCPGPAVALLAVPGNRETPLFLGGLLAGYIALYAIERLVAGAGHRRGAAVAGEPAGEEPALQ